LDAILGMTLMAPEQQATTLIVDCMVAQYEQMFDTKSKDLVTSPITNHH
jgi:hypothetical protein